MSQRPGGSWRRPSTTECRGYPEVARERYSLLAPRPACTTGRSERRRTSVQCSEPPHRRCGGASAGRASWRRDGAIGRSEDPGSHCVEADRRGGSAQDIDIALPHQCLRMLWRQGWHDRRRAPPGQRGALRRCRPGVRQASLHALGLLLHHRRRAAGSRAVGVAEAEPVSGLMVDHHVLVVAQARSGGAPCRGRPSERRLVDDDVAADPARIQRAAAANEGRWRGAEIRSANCPPLATRTNLIEPPRLQPRWSA